MEGYGNAYLVISVVLALLLIRIVSKVFEINDVRFPFKWLKTLISKISRGKFG